MMEPWETPCPPFFSEPTHEYTHVFKTMDYVRRYNDWYECIEAG